MIDETKRRAQLADFLKTRRARLRPEQLGLPIVGRRRTPGLRRDEVAQLAGIGVSWYTWLEQGRAITVSDQVLESLSRVLQLDEAERRHLYILARDVMPVPAETDQPPHSIQMVLDALGNSPAYLLDAHLNIVAWNASAARVFGDFSQQSGRDRNIVWQIFTHPEQHKLMVQWETAAQRAIMSFRAVSDQHAGEPWCEQLISDLKQASPEFRRWWAQHDIQWTCDPHHQKELNHPRVGSLLLSGTTLVDQDAPTFKLAIFTSCTPDTEAKLATLAQTERAYAQVY
ncbi:helix-turn-helix transcriptional regulator [Dictyobacter kobayashii]|uniref:Transcriptional regulator n=1 Tax=Dictyobacter kobayashii TaxID=2014872 RepID=A0A402AQC1_9CHLR|nr:helix-turn-helix transcriptional regulator [Dictyobacter kobayashii]GCE21317.1 transcriptional regulator [Dictyobacter kobayashii]